MCETRVERLLRACSACIASFGRNTNILQIYEFFYTSGTRLRHELYLQKELQSSKLLNEIETLKLKVSTKQEQINLLQDEVKLRNERERTKNDIILKLEDKTKNQAFELLRVQEEFISYKIHDSRESDSLICMDDRLISAQEKVLETKEKSREEPRINQLKTTNSSEATITENTEETVIKSSRRIEEGSHMDAVRSKTQSVEVEHDRKDSRSEPGKKVIIIGTSNIRFLSREYLSDDGVNIDKVHKYTIEEGENYIDQLDSSDDKDCYLFHILCNDVKSQNEEYCVEGINRIVRKLQDKRPNAKIVLSLGIPRNSEALNRKIEKINVTLKEKLNGKTNVFICDNSNLFYRGQAYRGMLNEDGLHLSRLGTRTLNKNMKGVIQNVFNIDTNEQCDLDRRRNKQSAK